MATVTSESSVRSFEPKPAYSVIPIIPTKVFFGVVGKDTWSFHYTHILHINENVLHLDEVTLPSATYLETTAKINHLKGDTLIIADSPNIGKVWAKTAVLYQSQANKVTGDNVYLFFSYVKIQVYAKKYLCNICRSPTDTESSLSCVAEKTSFLQLKFNDEGVVDLELDKGVISNPTFTKEGKLHEGKIKLAKSSAIKASDLDCSICCEKLTPKKEVILDCTFNHKVCFDCAIKLFGRMKKGTVQTSKSCPWRCVKPVTSYVKNRLYRSTKKIKEFYTNKEKVNS